jgi:hypothetical protein
MVMNLIRNASLLVLLGVVGLWAAQALPRLNAVEPGECKAGAEAVVKGENLGKNAVAELYLTDGKTDVKVVIVQQAADSIRFRVPSDARTGRFSLMVMTAGADPKLIEQPVKVTIQ